MVLLGKLAHHILAHHILAHRKAVMNCIGIPVLLAGVLEATCVCIPPVL